MNRFGSLLGCDKATGLNVCDTTETLLSGEDDVVDISPGSSMTAYLCIGWWTGW